MPVVDSTPLTIRLLEKPATGSHPRPPTPSERPFKRLSFTSKEPPRYPYYPKLVKLPLFNELPYNPALVPPILNFSFEQAKSHLIKADTRLELLFANLPSKHFERLEPVDLFQALVTAVIEYAFPSPGRVASLDSKILSTVGMNKIQAERVLDIAKRFADNQISAEKLLNASDKEAKEMLTAAQGVEEGTADMFAIMALRRLGPDILPVHSNKGF